jgi:hypothetical protein
MLSIPNVTMLERFLTLIHEYQSRILEAASLFEKHKGIAPSDLVYWKQADLPREGFIDPKQNIEYCFHGIGCRVNLLDGEVDWDFGHNGRLDGFDAWRLWRFASDGTDLFPEFKDKSVLDDTFAEAISQGIIHRPFRHLQDDLYYLRSVGAV